MTKTPLEDSSQLGECPSSKQAQWLQIVRQVLETLPCPLIEPAPPLCILHLGCGRGEFLLSFQEEYGKILPRPLFLLGMDQDSAMLSLGKKADVTSQIFWETAVIEDDSWTHSLEHLPQQRKFHLIFLSLPQEELSQREPLLQEVSELLSPGGTLFYEGEFSKLSQDVTCGESSSDERVANLFSPYFHLKDKTTLKTLSKESLSTLFLWSQEEC